MKALYVTDVHGHEATYERLLEKARNKSVSTVLIGGDTCPGFNSLYQKRFLSEYLIPRFSRFRKEVGKPVFIIMGNDDLGANTGLFEQAEKKGYWKFMHAKIASLGEYTIAGYQCINPTPFMLKDWEREEEEIAKELGGLARAVRGKKTIMMFHAPPFGTALDVLHDGRNVGSVAILKFIETLKPDISLHGHIHESAMMSGVMSEKIGKTLCVNPGSRVIVEIDLAKKKVEVV